MTELALVVFVLLAFYVGAAGCFTSLVHARQEGIKADTSGHLQWSIANQETSTSQRPADLICDELQMAK